MCFLINFSIFLGIDIKCEINSFCDNIQVVKASSHPMESARGALCPDYDVLQQIKSCQESLRQKGARLQQCQHGKGHQDRSTEQQNLSLQAKLNIRADSIASHMLRFLRSNKVIPTMFDLPTCNAYLINGGETQTSKEQWTCRWKWSEF